MMQFLKGMDVGKVRITSKRVWKIVCQFADGLVCEVVGGCGGAVVGQLLFIYIYIYTYIMYFI